MAYQIQTLVNEFLRVDVQLLEEITQTLEDRPVGQFLSVIYESVVASVFTFKVCFDHVGDLADAPAKVRSVQDINDSPRRIRNLYSRFSPPDILGPE